MSDNLPDDPETLKAMLLAALHESERLRQIIKELQRHHFGRKAETLPEEQSKRSFFPTLLQAGFPSICVSS
jgi:hypothetical protein